MSKLSKVIVTIVVIVVFIVLLPIIFGETGIWLTVPFSEAVTVVIAFNYMRKSSDKLSLSYEKR